MNAKAFVIKLRLSKHSMSRLHTLDCLPIGVGSRLRTASTIRFLPSTRKVFSRGSTASRKWGAISALIGSWMSPIVFLGAAIGDQGPEPVDLIEGSGHLIWDYPPWPSVCRLGPTAFLSRRSG